MTAREMTIDTEKRKAVYIRLNADEHQRISEESTLSGISPPELMKRSHFATRPFVPLLSRADFQDLTAALSRIGNNINQIAHQLNSGIRSGSFNDAFERLVKEVQKLGGFMSAKYCRCSLYPKDGANGGC